MGRYLSVLLAGPSLFVVATVAAAQPAGPPAPGKAAVDPATQALESNEAAEKAGDEGAIIVTARRRAESQLDVPQTVNAVTGRDMEEYSVQKFEDISQLVPGLTLNSDNSGFNATAQVRGVNFQVTAQGTPTVEIYMNEVPVDPNIAFQSIFDIGQIEVLRGPQGTVRGRSSPSGSITQTTRRPDLNEVGGYMSMTGSSLGDLNYQAAFSIPIINDVLALRVAGLLDKTDAGGVKSANSGVDPEETTKGFRATLRFEPSDSLSAVLVYQRIIRELHSYGGIQFGTGAIGRTDCPNFLCPATANAPAIFAPPGFNGPVLLEADADEHGRAVADIRNFSRNAAHQVTAQVDWRFSGQKLSYVGGYFNADLLNLTDGDGTNTIVGVARKPSRNACCTGKVITQELRLTSDERLFGMLDYTVGGFYNKYTPFTINENLNQFVLPGAFGSPLGTSAPGGPGTLSPFTYDPKYTFGFTNIIPDKKELEKAVFATLMLHIGDSTELSAGGRQIWKSAESSVAPVVTNGIAAFRNPNGLGPCPATLSGSTGVGLATNAPVVGSTYAGTCDVLITPTNGGLAQVIRPVPFSKRSWSPFVYNFSISHKFTPDIMAYASYGSSWRFGPGPVIAAPNCASFTSTNAPDPHYCDSFLNLDPETSKGAEIGFKAALLDRRLNVAVALYRQKFDGYFVRALESVPFLQGDCSTPANQANSQICGVANGTFTYNADVLVKGIDAEANFRLSEDLNVSALFSWSKGEFKNSLIPCRDTNFDGTPDNGTFPANSLYSAWSAAGGTNVFGPAQCANAGTSTTAPPWNVTLRGEYSHEVFTGGRAFIRGLFNYYPKNTNRPRDVSVDTVPVTAVAPESYSLLSLWIGLRGERGDWEVAASAKNLLNNRTVLSRDLQQGTLISPSNSVRFAPSAALNTSGYRGISFVDRREFQLSFRYAFGSR